MTYKEILELIKMVSRTDLAEVKVRDENTEVVIRTQNFQSQKDAPAYITTVPQQAVSQPAAASAAPATAAPATTESAQGSESGSAGRYKEVRSPMVGTFYRSPSPDKPPFVKPGDVVSNGSVVCIIEAMKLFNEIESDVSGTIVKIMVEDASPVEYDQVLFLIE